jgi:hypothetical protein
MPVTFPCACGAALSVRDDPPVYFVKCPKCAATNKVPHPKKKAKPAAADPGFEVIDETRPRSTAYDRRKAEPEPEEADPHTGYGLGTEENVRKTATRGNQAGTPYEVSQEEFEEEAKARRGSRGARKLKRFVGLTVIAVIGIGAFAAAGLATRSIDPQGKGKVGAGIARMAVVFTFLIVALVYWLLNQMGDDDEA